MAPHGAALLDTWCARPTLYRCCYSRLSFGSPRGPPHVLALGALVEDIVVNAGTFVPEQSHQGYARMVIEHLDLYPAIDHDFGTPIADPAAEYAPDFALPNRADALIDPDHHELGYHSQSREQGAERALPDPARRSVSVVPWWAMEDVASITAYLRSRAAYYRRQAAEAAEPDQATYCCELAETFDREAAAWEKPSYREVHRKEATE